MNRWPIEEVQALLDEELPAGIEALWNAVPQGYSQGLQATENARKRSQEAIVQSLAVVGRKVVAANGVFVGFRPESFNLVAGLPAVDVLADVAKLTAAAGLDLSQLTDQAKDAVIGILGKAGKAMGVEAITPQYSAAIGAVVAVVWQTVTTINTQYQAWKASEEASLDAALSCAPPAFSPTADADFVAAAIELLKTPIWENLFLPEVHPVLPSRGFTCCASTADRGRVIAPVGAGYGNRHQQIADPIFYGEGFGFGCLPMCPGLPVHRAIIVPGGGGQPYDPAASLPLLAGLGIQAAHLMWNGGPAAFTVDGRKLAEAWADYFSLMRAQIAGNKAGHGTYDQTDAKFWELFLGIEGESTDRVCDEWDQAGRSRALLWLYERIGVDVRAADPDGIYSFLKSAPATGWRAFEIYQLSLLGYDKNGKKVGPPRLVAAYVDARNCHPAWRKRVALAQEELLVLGDAVCRMDLDSIHDPTYLEKVKARRKQKGPVCYAMFGKDVAYGPVSATKGPSIDPLGEGSPPIPAMPTPPRRVAAPKVLIAQFIPQVSPPTGGAAVPFWPTLIKSLVGGVAAGGLTFWLLSKRPKRPKN